MAATNEKLKAIVDDLTPLELGVVAETAELVVSTRQSRYEKISELMRKIETLDEVSRLVVGLYLETSSRTDLRMVKAGRCGWTEEMLGLSHRERVYNVAPGVFWAWNKRDLHEAMRQTGEFKGFGDFDEAADALGFTGRRTGEVTRYTIPQALDTLDHLVHWLAAKYPESDAAGTVRYYGTPKGRLVHGGTRGYNSESLLFHESVLEEYVAIECTRGEAENGPHRPIITLVATGDWDKAVSLCSPRKQRQLNQ